MILLPLSVAARLVALPPQALDANSDQPASLPVALPAGMERFPLVLHSISGYTFFERSYSHRLTLTADAIHLDLRQAKATCQRRIALSSQERKAIGEAVKRIGFCRRKSRFEVRVADAPQDTISMGAGSKKTVWQRRPKGEGNYGYLCKGGRELYQSLGKALATPERSGQLASCPDFTALLR